MTNWKERLALRRGDGHAMLQKRAANIQLHANIRQQQRIHMLEHEGQRVKNLQSSMGSNFPEHMKKRQEEIEGHVKNLKGNK
jgi:hypothetical protein